MKKAIRYLALLLGIVLVAAGGFAAFVALRGIPSYKAQKLDLHVDATPTRLERGQKLASMLCASCHLDPNTGKLTGRQMEEAPQFGAIYSKNITAHKTAGIGSWSDGDLIYLLRTGLKPDGTYLPPYMAKLVNISDEDLYSIVAFLRSGHPWVQPDNTRQPDTKPSFLTKFLCNIGAMKPFPFPTRPIPGPDTTNPVQWGKYIATAQLECFSCHSKDFSTNDYFTPEKSKGFFGGGNEMVGMDGHKLKTLNITMDAETGIGTWSEASFINAVKYGQVPNGQPALRLPMMPYTNLTDAEVKAIYAYLKTVPPVKNKVERSE
ncbi:MAG: hypothetical protein JWP27_2809 [Flaviaesturariibacter sp.]|nr:hypothetical protein [Flaviaesturariibacter sp.]